jgi:hypothetical protein
MPYSAIRIPQSAFGTVNFFMDDTTIANSRINSLLKKVFFFRMIKNAQMQGAREPFTCRSGRQS